MSTIDLEEFRRWITDDQRKSARTAAAYVSDLRLFLQWAAETYGQPFNWPPGPKGTEALEQDLLDYRVYLKGPQQAKPATINRKLAALSRFVEWGQRTQGLQGPPLRKLPWEQLAPLAPRALDSKDLNRLLRETRRLGSVRDVAIVQMLAQTGLRAGELAALRLEDVELGKRGGQITVRQGKNSRYREIPLNADVRRALREYLEERPNARTDAVFVSQRGGPISANVVWRVVSKYAQMARLDVSPHILRHTFCTRLLREQGADLVSVATLAGHSIATTVRYTQPSRDTLRELTEGLAKRSGDE